MAKKKGPPASTVPLPLWRDLYKAAAGFQLLAPWRWMDDTHIFGANNEHGFRLVTVLGNMDEVFGLASYRGSAGTSFLLRLRRGELPPESPDTHFCQDALLVDFVPRKDLRKEDRAIMQQIEFQPPVGKPKLFPEFQSHKPGYVPWFIDEAEARLLLDDLRKAVCFAELLRNNLALFDLRQGNEFPFFPASVIEPLALDQFEWRTIKTGPSLVDPPVDTRAFDLPVLLALPQPAKTVWELTTFYSPMPVGEGPRPYFPKLALGVDAATGAVLSFQLASPEHTMAQAAARGLVQSIQAAGCRPAVIRVDSINLIRALQPLADALGAELLQAKPLPMADEARRFMEAFSRPS
ncbi:MAG TPA: hypothetical protein VNZ64_02835 [Candidatus Acidoferrum sp.]|jgi:hypothetical protein|nr:hypothetical protein [Candidatus Acidoferrum sp.]